MNQELAVIPAKITDVLVITPDIEGDLYNEKSQEAIKKIIEWLESLVFDDDQEEEMDEATTAMNKFATGLDKLSAATYKKVTESASANRDTTKTQVAAIRGHRTRIISQGEAKKKARLDGIKSHLEDALAEAWAEKGVSLHFRKSTVPEPKKTMLTDKGALTLATKRTIEKLAQDDKNWQLEIEGRIKDVKLACHEAGITTPFTESYIGDAFYGQDRAAFEKRLELLVNEELMRREREKEKMRLELEAEHNRKTELALAEQKRELERAAPQKVAENAPVVQPEKPTLTASQYGLKTSVQVTPAPKQTDSTQEDRQEQAYTGEVRITLSFVLPLKAPTTKEFLKGWFLNSLPEKVRNALTAFEVENV